MDFWQLLILLSMCSFVFFYFPHFFFLLYFWFDALDQTGLQLEQNITITFIHLFIM